MIPSGELGVLLVDRATEFAPIKNSNGLDSNNPAPDTPDSAKKYLMEETTEWLSHVDGLTINGQAKNKVELSYLLSYRGENLEKLKDIFEGGVIDKPCYIDEKLKVH